MLPFFITGFLIAFLIFVPAFEWLLHRHTMHTEKKCWLFNDLYRLHDKTHHIIFDHANFYTKKESDIQRAPSLREGLSFNGYFMIGIIAIHGSMYIIGLIPLIFFLGWIPVVVLLCGLLSGSGAFGFLQIKFHYWYHAADGFGYRVLAQLPLAGRYFLYMVEHHRKHHEDTSRYLNTLVPTVDLTIGYLQRLFR